MPKATDLGFTVEASPVTDGNLDDFKVQFAGTKEKIKIPKWVEIAEV